MNIVSVDTKLLNSVGMLSIVEHVQREAGNLTLMQFETGEEIFLLAASEHVHFWRYHQTSFAKEVDRLPSSAAVGRTLLGSALSTARDGPEWKSARRLSTPFLRPNVSVLTRSMKEATWWLVDELRDANGPIDVFQACTTWSLKAVCRPLLGNAISENRIRNFLAQFRTAYFRLIAKSDLMSIEDLTQDPEAISLRALMDELIVEAISMDAEQDLSMVKDVYARTLGNVPDNLRTEIIRSVVIGTLAGAVDNVGTALTWNLIHLGRLPDERERIGFEAKGKKDDTEAFSLPLATSSVCESLRLMPVQPLIERRTTVMVDLLGEVLPQNASVFFSPWLVQRNPFYWNNPLQFDIGRFMPEQVIDSSRYFPFGVGSRTCVGMSLSIRQLTLATSEICRNVDFRLSSQSLPAHIRPMFRLNLTPRGPVFMDITPKV